MKVRIAALVSLLSVGAGLAVGADWPQIPEAELAMQQAPGDPNAPAVVLFERGRLVLKEELSSYLEVYRRVKVLKREGAEYGSVTVLSSDYLRMKELEGRTHRPDGTVVELPADAVFTKRRSTFYNRMVNTFAMPEVTAGAIIEYRYKLYFDSVFFTRPWFFQDEIPVLHSELECVVPDTYTFQPVKVQTLRNLPIHEQVSKSAWGVTITYSMDNLPAIPDEPFHYPFEALSSRVQLLPKMYYGGVKMALLTNWDHAVDLVVGTKRWGYERFRAERGGIKRKVAELTASADASRARAEAIYRFVRDEIVTEPVAGIGIGDTSAHEVLSKGRGDVAAKGLLLAVMLEAAGVESTLVWTSPADAVRLTDKVADLHQFDNVLVRLELGDNGSPVYLDPTDRRLGFGLLPPELEGVPCLLLRRRHPEWSTIPATPAEVSRRLARVTLELDADGRLSGAVNLTLTGHRAWERLAWRESDDETTKAWEEWAEAAMPGFDVEGLNVVEDVEARRVEVQWRLEQREEEVLGDQAEVVAAAPLARTGTPFSLPPRRRLTPVHLPYAYLDRVELDLKWPPGWELAPPAASHDLANPAGAVVTELDLDEPARALHLVRELRVEQRDHMDVASYSAVRDLYAAAVDNDAQMLLLSR